MQDHQLQYSFFPEEQFYEILRVLVAGFYITSSTNTFVCYSLLGGILIIAALFVVSWGKSKEIKKITQPVPEEDTSIEDQEREKSSDRNNDQLVQEQKNVSIESHADQIEITVTIPKK